MSKSYIDIRHLRKEVIEILTPIYGARESGALCRSLLGHYIQKTPFELALNPDMIIGPSLYEAIKVACSRLKEHEPIQYITGNCLFYEKLFQINEYVLIPRPETEELVERIVKDHGHLSENRELKVLDIGTGSGIIAISLQLEMPQVEMMAIDISPEALAIASKNAARLGARVSFKHQDIFSAQKEDFTKLDVIVSNPPYVLESDKQLMAPNVLNFEPDIALYVPDESSLRYYEKICSLANEWLAPGGSIYFEINESKGAEMKQLLKSHDFAQIQLVQDGFQKDRFAFAQKPLA